MIPIILILAVALPAAWLMSEFQDWRWLRILLGVCSIALSYLIATTVGQLSRLNYNVWYGSASAQLIDTVIRNIEDGNEEALLRELRQLRADYEPTYENRANYDQLVEQFAARLNGERDEVGEP